MSDSLKYYCGDGRVDDCGPASSDIFEKLHSLLQEKKKEEKNQSDDEQEQQETDVGCGALESGLQNILGLESGHAAHPKQVRTLQCGEFKFPDVTSPLNKILSSCGGDRFRPSLESCSSAGMSTSSFGFAGSPFNYRTSCSSGNSSDGTAAGHRNNNGNRFHGVSPMHASQLDFHRISVSPDSSSDDAGYGTSYGSGYANANGAQQNQSAERSTFMADRNPAGGGDKEEGEEEELNHLLKCLRTSGELSPSLFPNPRYSSTHGNVTFGGERRPLLKNAEGFANDGFHTAFNNGFERAGPVFARGEQQQHGEARYASMQQQPYFSCSSALYATPHFESASSSSCSPHFGLPPSSSSSSVAFATPTDVAASDATMGSNQATNSSLSALERAARIHRKGTALHNASCRWSGQLPCRNIAESNLSCKVFLGGVPWDITEGNLIQCFKSYGLVRVEWPGRENGAFGAGGGPEHLPRGYLYVIFEDEKQVKALLSECTQSYTNGGSWYYKISSRRMKNKEVQVIPWIISDSNHILVPMRALDSQKTVFVGALHGMLTAEALCKIFNDIFGGVVYAGVDTDKYKYPIGSGRVTFDNHKSYMKAVVAAFIEIETDKFNKKVQVDPYLEDALCSSCGLRQGPYFCREVVCFKYFCRSCWEANHTNNSLYRQHKPLMRNNKRTNMANSPFAKAAFFNRE